MGKSNITINWKGKENKRGLSETAIELLERKGSTFGKTPMLESAERLRKEYSGLQSVKVFSFQEELEVVRKHVNVVI